MMDKIRVIKLLVYEGPRNVVEQHLKHTADGTRWHEFHGCDDENNRIEGRYSITGITLGQFPEILERIPE